MDDYISLCTKLIEERKKLEQKRDELEKTLKDNDKDITEITEKKKKIEEEKEPIRKEFINQYGIVYSLKRLVIITLLSLLCYIPVILGAVYFLDSYPLLAGIIVGVGEFPMIIAIIRYIEKKSPKAKQLEALRLNLNEKIAKIAKVNTEELEPLLEKQESLEKEVAEVQTLINSKAEEIYQIMEQNYDGLLPNASEQTINNEQTKPKEKVRVRELKSEAFTQNP